MEKASNQILVIFGASGDLTGRKLVPSLFKLWTRGLLPDRLAILGASRTAYDDESFRAEMLKHLEGEGSEEFAKILFYVAFDSTDAADYGKLSDKLLRLKSDMALPDRILFYLATPPFMYEIVPQCLKRCGLNIPVEPDGWRRIVIEKPFGLSLETAQQLNEHLKMIFNEEDIYRIDHYLGKETVQNILALRFANEIFQGLWNRNYIDSVVIKATETLGVENRGRYYDSAGALRDMVQNHLMQLMGFVAMEAPFSVDPEPMRDEVVKVFRSLRPYTRQDMDSLIVRGQYVGYRNEKDVASGSVTPTYIAMKMFVDNWRWKDVPFFIITGKKMSEKLSEVVINFKSTPVSLFSGQCEGSSCNKLIIRIQPNEGITLRFGLKIPGAGFKVEQVGMDFKYSTLEEKHLPDAYERLLLDAMQGDYTLYARNDALEAGWRLIDPILAYWEEIGDKDLYMYDPGQDGPWQKQKLGIPTDVCVVKK